MIHFLASMRFARVISGYFDEWAPDLRSSVRILAYESLDLRQPFPSGTYVFTDLERLLRTEWRLARRVAERLESYPEHYRVLNHPARWLNRFALLHLLAVRGENDFHVFRVRQLTSDARFPMFLRREYDHGGSCTALLETRDEVREAVRQMPWRDRTLLRDRLMLEEYLHTADVQGIFRKYSAFSIAGRIVPRHVLFSTNWITKHPDLSTEETAREESEFISAFPHAKAVENAFRLAGVEYGRIDFGILDGRIQVWEINTNPIIVPPRERIVVERNASQLRSAELIRQAFEQLAEASPRAESLYPLRIGDVIVGKATQWIGRRYSKKRW